MDTMDNQTSDAAIQNAVPAVHNAEAPAPWEMIEPGRYQPKRTRGSCVGRELG